MAEFNRSGLDRLIPAFHGTTHKNAKKIVGEKIFKVKNRSNHWLGKGAYFFREDPEQAKMWARQVADKKEATAVISTEIPAKSSYFLNMDARDGYEFFTKFRKEIDKQTKNIKFKHPDEHTLMNFYCNFLPDEIKIIQRTFETESKLNHENKKIGLHLNGVQLCVRDQSIINFNKMRIIHVNYGQTSKKMVN
ncbi:hypothetical protein [Bacillus licheniformis]|uniref:hypothetical protein n=1 Tax=Bacillus licheniformis TaxID=1402 RepID=UPI00237D328D|nr:hypothetical protein [Bacillus licheniformis]MDE1424701.1 hypothetical protein [Bacillus licheniformis]